MRFTLQNCLNEKRFEFKRQYIDQLAAKKRGFMIKLYLGLLWIQNIYKRNLIDAASHILGSSQQVSSTIPAGAVLPQLGMKLRV